MSRKSRNDPRTQPALRRLSGEDAIFVYGETPLMPMHTMGTVLLDPSGVPGGFDFERIARTVASRIHLIPPFRQRLLEVPLGLGHPVLVDDPDFDLANHLHRVAVPAPGGLRELAGIVGDLAGRLLDRHQPLWEMWAVEGLEGGRIALVMKMHHCMIDGASGSSQMAGLMDLTPDARPDPPAVPWSPAPLPSWLTLAARSAGSRLVGPARLGRLAFGTAREMWERGRARRRIERESGAGEGDLPVPRTLFNRALSAHRSVAYGSIPLEAVKRVKNAFGVTVNDAVLAASALALRRYLQAREALPAEPLLCAVPISLKSDREKQDFSNKVSSLWIRLPTQLGDPEAVVRAVRRETERAKTVHGATEEDMVPAWLELAPPLLTTAGVRLFSELHLADRTPPFVNVIVSNMKGPPVPLYFGGARVEAVYPMGPVGEGMGLNITLLSNMGRIDVGVLTCREIVPDPWEIAEDLSQALAELERAAEKIEKPEGRVPDPSAPGKDERALSGSVK
jgi:WS/DGAT/MGAT family acyltransferase